MKYGLEKTFERKIQYHLERNKNSASVDIQPISTEFQLSCR